MSAKLANTAIGGLAVTIGCLWPLILIGFWALVAAALAKYVLGWSPF